MPCFGQMRVMIYVLFFMSILIWRGFGASSKACEWGVRLCGIGDPLTSTSICNFESPLASLSGGIEVQDLNSKVQTIIDHLVDQPVDPVFGDKRYLGFPYYLRVDLLCGDKESSVRAIQEAFLTGLSPIIYLTFQEPIHPTRLKPQRLETILDTAPLKDSVPCDSDLCQMGWYAPMPILNGSVVYRVKVVSNGQGKIVPDESFSINVNGFVRSTKRGDVEISFGLEMPVLEDMLTLGSPSRPLWAVVDHTPVIILPGIPRYKAVLMTATGFLDTRIIEVGIESCWAGSLNCPQVGEFSSMILEAISTESSLFIRQNQLVHRFVGNYSLLANKNPPSDLWDQVLRSKCVSRMVPVLVPYDGREYLYIVGGGWQKGTLFKAEIYDGDASYTELFDSKGRTVCEFMNTQPCRVMWAALDSLHNLTDMVLVELLPDIKKAPTYHLVLLIKDYVLAEPFPKFIPKGNNLSFTTVTKKQENTTVHLEPRGMFYNPSSDSLFIWGNALFVSQDGGKSYLFFHGFPLDQMIKYFTLSFQGEFAFVTETEELWWGQEGVAELVRIYPSLGWQAFSSIEALKGHTYYYNNSLLTIFFDWDRQLQEVVYHVDSKGKGHVVKRNVPVPEILSYSQFTAAPLEVHHLREFSAFTFPLICPFFWEHLEHLPQPEPFNRIQYYETRPPLVSISTGLHSTASLATYNGLLYHLLLLHSEYIMDIGDPVNNPTSRWWQNKLQYQDYYFYMSSNSVSSSGFNVQMDGYIRNYLKSEIVFPDKVYLDRRSSYTFSIYLASGHADQLTVEKKPRELSDIGYIWLSAVVSDYHYLYVSLTRRELFNRGAVIYEVTVSDRELYSGQALAGQRLMPFSLLLRVSNSDMQCYQATDNSVALKGQYRLPIYIGCPPGNRLAFDITTTLEQCTRINKRYFNCPEPDPAMPCFYYDDMFYPYFLIQDLVTGESKRFRGSYTFKVVGGGPFSQENIRMYTPQEVLQYNTMKYSAQKTLIWITEESTDTLNITKDGYYVLHEATNKIRWRCERHSPCGDMAVESLKAPDFFFVIEISNKGVDLSTYCDYALQFVVHVHGFPLDPTRGLSYTLMITGTLYAFFMVFVLYNFCGPAVKKLWGAVQHLTTHKKHESDVSLSPSEHTSGERPEMKANTNIS